MCREMILASLAGEANPRRPPSRPPTWLRSAVQLASQRAPLVNQRKGDPGFSSGAQRLAVEASHPANVDPVASGSTRTADSRPWLHMTEDLGGAHADGYAVAGRAAGGWNTGRGPALLPRRTAGSTVHTRAIVTRGRSRNMARNHLNEGRDRRSQRGAGRMLLSGFTKRVIREGDLTIIDAAGRRHQCRRWPGATRRHPIARQGSASSPRHRSLPPRRRSLHGRHADPRGGLALRFSRHLRGQRRAGRRPSPEPRGRCAEPSCAGSINTIRSTAPRPTQRITTTCPARCTACSSIATASTRAPTSATSMTTWSRRNGTRSATWRPSCC